ncbi:hypothetical protein DFH07DRAFT_80421 [Mycena maculata]|uniref:Uncharacterized protein n=1 Tax=Mycena maculata TaxID=230809 RepID=A0AAD7MZI7_9AGAR|nr:hypothetical protein DFH07DRAFT_80421 [Mycena maculata]
MKLFVGRSECSLTPSLQLGTALARHNEYLQLSPANVWESGDRLETSKSTASGQVRLKSPSLLPLPTTRMTSFACIPADPDISGIGVRVAVYAQNFLSFIPAVMALRDGIVTESELEATERHTKTILITAFAILISAMVEARTVGLSNFHAGIVLNLSWMNNTNTFIYFLLYVRRKSQGYIPMEFSAWTKHYWKTLWANPMPELGQPKTAIRCRLYRNYQRQRRIEAHRAGNTERRGKNRSCPWRPPPFCNGGPRDLALEPPEFIRKQHTLRNWGAVYCNPGPVSSPCVQSTTVLVDRDLLASPRT